MIFYRLRNIFNCVIWYKSYVESFSQKSASKGMLYIVKLIPYKSEGKKYIFFFLDHKCANQIGYGNMCCQVFELGVQNRKDFGLKNKHT